MKLEKAIEVLKDYCKPYTLAPGSGNTMTKAIELVLAELNRLQYTEKVVREALDKVGFIPPTPQD